MSKHTADAMNTDDTTSTTPRAAGEYLRNLRATGRRIKGECVVTNEQGYYGQNVRTVVVGA
ncbi:MAG: hypothetical protein ACK5ZS_01530 [bacterium]|jgi:hypothetical protein